MSLPPWLSTCWAVAGCCTFLGGAVWIIFIFWPALKEQLAFIRESRREMAAGIADRREMVEALKNVKESIEGLKALREKAEPAIDKASGIVERLEQYDWETAVTKGVKFFAFADDWASKITPDRIKRGTLRMDRALEVFNKVANLVTGNGSK